MLECYDFPTRKPHLTRSFPPFPQRSPPRLLTVAACASPDSRESNYVAFNGDVIRALARKFLALAEEQGAPVPLMIAHRMMGCSLASTGSVAEARVHFDRAVALYDPAAHRALAARFGQDNRVTALSYGSVVVWLLGYPDAALAYADRAVKDARELGQAAALMYSLFHTSLTTIFSGRYEAANVRLDELAALAEEKNAVVVAAFRADP